MKKVTNYTEFLYALVSTLFAVAMFLFSGWFITHITNYSGVGFTLLTLVCGSIYTRLAIGSWVNAYKPIAAEIAEEKNVLSPQVNLYCDTEKIFTSTHGLTINRATFEELGDPMAAILLDDDSMQALVQAADDELTKTYALKATDFKTFQRLSKKTNPTEKEEERLEELYEVILPSIEETAIKMGMPYYEDFTEDDNKRFMELLAND